MYAPLVVNVANRPEWSGSISTTVFPRPLTTAMMYDLKRGRPVLFAEAWAAQGFAHSQLPCIPEKMKDAFNSSAFASSGGEHAHVSFADEQTLVGNTMHWAMIGSFFTYMILSTDKGMMRCPCLEDAETGSHDE